MKGTKGSFKGIYPAAITPFDESEEVDISRLEDFLDFLIEGGVHGIYLLGTNGEAPLLTMDEKKRIIGSAVDHVGGRVPLIAGTMCNDTKGTIELARYAEDEGADAVHVIVPYFFPSPKRSLVKHFKSISENIDLPIFIYSIPQRTGNRLDIETLKTLSEIDKVVGFKDSSGDLESFYSASVDTRDLISFGGNDSLIYSYLSLGGDGAVTAVGNVFPELVSSIYEHHQRGDHIRAKELQDKVLHITQALKKGPYLSGVKAALKLRGMDFGDVRSPLLPFSRGEMKKLKADLERLNML